MAKVPVEKKVRESKVDPDESKHDKFLRLGKARATKALKAIAQIENLAGSNYEYSEEEANAIVTALNNAVVSVKEKLTKSATKDEIAFEF